MRCKWESLNKNGEKWDHVGALHFWPWLSLKNLCWYKCGTWSFDIRSVNIIDELIEKDFSENFYAFKIAIKRTI